MTFSAIPTNHIDYLTVTSNYIVILKTINHFRNLSYENIKNPTKGTVLFNTIFFIQIEVE